MTGSLPDGLPARVCEAVNAIRTELSMLRSAETAQARERAVERISSEIDVLIQYANSKASGSSDPGWVDPVVRMIVAEVIREILTLLPCASTVAQRNRERRYERYPRTDHRGGSGLDGDVAAKTSPATGRRSVSPVPA